MKDERRKSEGSGKRRGLRGRMEAKKGACLAKEQERIDKT